MIKQFISDYTANLGDSTINNLMLEYLPNKDEGMVTEIKVKMDIVHFKEKNQQIDVVELHFMNVQQFSYSDTKGNGCLIQESKIKIIDSEMLFDFNYYNEWETKVELIKANSQFFIICKDFVYKVISNG